VGIIEIAMTLFVSSLLEGGLRDAARFGITGFTPAGVTREEAILDHIDQVTLGLIDPADIQIVAMIYPDFDQIGGEEPYDDTNTNGQWDVGESYNDINGNGQWDADMGQAGMGGPGDVVVYSLEAPWTIMTPLLSSVLGEDGQLMLRASIAVRNEPFLNAGVGG
ncbi:MAG: hypothetical protein RII27_06490, partial [Alphaproteobacteria bacterium]